MAEFTGEFYHGTYQSIKHFDSSYSGETTANNDHNCFFFSSEFEVAKDYSRAAIERRIDGRDTDELINDLGYTPEEAIKLAADEYTFIEDSTIVYKVGVFIGNPLIIEYNCEPINCEEVQNIIGHLKGQCYHEETADRVLDHIECTCDDDDDECECEPPEFDGLVLLRCIDNIGDASRIIQDEIICFYPHQIRSIKTTKGER